MLRQRLIVSNFLEFVIMMTYEAPSSLAWVVDPPVASVDVFDTEGLSSPHSSCTLGLADHIGLATSAGSSASY